MKFWIVVLIVWAAAGVSACGGPDFEAALFDGDGGAGGGEWSSSSSGQVSSSSSGRASTSSSAGGSGAEGATVTVGAGASAGMGPGGEAGSGPSSTSTSATSGSGGAGGSEAVCGPETCAGCCDASGDCVTGDIDAACGQGGEACTTCADSCGWEPPNYPTTWCAEGAGVFHAACQAGQCAVVGGECCLTQACDPSTLCG